MQQWFYAKDGQTAGPIGRDELVRLLGTGSLSPSDLVWRKGMTAWMSASSIQELQPEPPPPLPSSLPGEPDLELYAPPSSPPPGAPGSDDSLEPVPPGTHFLSPGDCIRGAASLFFGQFSRILPIVLAHIAILFAVSWLTGWIDLRTGLATPPDISPDAPIADQLTAFLNSQSLFSRLVNQAVQCFLGIGLSIVYLKMIRRRLFSFQDLFSGGSLFFRIFVAQLIFNIILAAGLILFIVPGIYFAVRYAFYELTLIDRGIPRIGQAFEIASGLTAGNRVNVLFLFFLCFAVIVIGALALLVGLIAAIPVAQLAFTLAYHRLTYDQPGS